MADTELGGGIVDLMWKAIGKLFALAFKGSVAGAKYLYELSKNPNEMKKAKNKIVMKAVVSYFVVLIFILTIMSNMPVVDSKIHNFASLLHVLTLMFLVFNTLNKITSLNQNYQDITAPPELTSTAPRGFIFGMVDNYHITRHEVTDGHILVVGGVGSGKSSCIAIPTLRSWGESVFAIDIKGELYEKSKRFRPNIKVFNPLDDNSYGYDPFFCLRASHNPAQEARAIAQSIIPLPPDTREPFWIESAQNIFTASIMHYKSQGTQRSKNQIPQNRIKSRFRQQAL